VRFLSSEGKERKKESGERRRSSVVCIGTFHRSRKMEVAVELNSDGTARLEKIKVKRE